MKLCDVSPGTVLVAGKSGDEYIVRRDDGDRVTAIGPHGLVTVDADELQQNIANGLVRVKS